MNALIAWLFFLTGFTATFSHTVVPKIQDSLNMGFGQLMAFEACFYLGYLCLSPLAAMSLARLGYKKSFCYGIGTTVVACASFYPAGIVGRFSLFLLGNFLLGGGIAFIQVLGNPLAVVTAAQGSSASRLTFFQGFNALGTVLAPGFAAYCIFGGQDPTTRVFILPYGFLALLFFSGLIPLSFLSFPPADGRPASSSLLAWWKDPAVLLTFMGIFAYIGAEVAVASFLVRFLESTGVSLNLAALISMLFWLGFMLGRFLGAKTLRADRAPFLLLMSALAAMVLLSLAACLEGALAATCIILVGFCNSIMFPTIFALGLERAKVSVGTASGAICAAHIGGVIFPLAQGALADAVGLSASLLLPLVAYALVAAFSRSIMKVASRASLKAA